MGTVSRRARARASWLRWILPLSLGGFVDCAETDGASYGVATLIPRGLEGPAARADRGIPSACAHCGRACADDMTCVAEACVPRSGSAPRLLLPASLGRVTSRRPTMRWISPQGATGSRVEVCRDRACGDVALTAETSGNALRPEAALAPGVYFWRVFPRLGSRFSEKASETWSFVVRPRDAEVDSSFGRLWDFNGDGYADVFFTYDPDRPRAALYYGGPDGPSARPDLIVPEAIDGAEVRASAAGDVNGDGFADLLLRLRRPEELVAQRVLLVPGGPRPGLERAVALSSAEPWPERLSGGADLDNDGYADLVGVDPERDGAPSVIRVWYGGTRGVEPAPRRLLEGAPGSGFGRSVAGTGDLNGDSLPDLVIGAPAQNGGAGRVVAWINGRCAEGALVDLGRGAAAGGRFGDVVALAGDLNGDGYADPVVAEPFGPRDIDRGAVHVFAGPAEPAPASRALPFAGPQMEDLRLVHGGDYDGDGWSDLVVWLHNEQRGPSFMLYRGGPAGPSERPTRVVYPQEYGATETALSVLPAGDTDRDGYDDLVVFLAPGQVLIARGGPGGVTVGPTPFIAPP